MKDDELETVEHLHGKSPDKNIDWKEWRDFTWINGYLVKKSESLKKKGGRVGKTKTTWNGWNKHRWENLELILRMLKMIGSTWREAHRLRKELTWRPRWSRRISIHIAIWEHRLWKVWIQHLTSKQLEYHKWNKTKDLACRISRNKHMIEIPSEIFVVGPTRARLYSTIMYKAVHMTYEVSRTSIAKGSLRHNGTTVKMTVERRTTRRRTPISYHASVEKIF